MAHLPDTRDLVARLRSAGCVFAEDEARLLLDATRDRTELATLVERRVAGEPLEYVLGWAEFCGLRIAVHDGVFVPRRRTELLAQHAIELIHAHAHAHAPATPVAVDLCCGSGALGAALVAAEPRLELHAADIDPVACACARGNLPPQASVHQGDLFNALPAKLRGHIDVLVTNVPYVPSGAIATMPPEARDHEPIHALDGGADGLDVLRRVGTAAPTWLAPGGHLLIETSERQLPQAIDAFTVSGLTTQIAHDDDLGATVVIATANGNT
ncbi:MAG: putative protein N(5)-glutamine methyltransferase [Jatrophihabitantaceae bacterium]